MEQELVGTPVNAVAVKPINAIMQVVPDEGFDGSIYTEIDMKDLLIPKLLVAQATSKVVQNELATVGQLVNSVTGEVVADRGKEVEMLIISSKKSWFIYDKVTGQPEFVEELPYTSENSHWEKERELDILDENNKIIKKLNRQVGLTFMLLDASKASDPSSLPFAMTCKMTQYTAGRALINHIAQLAAIKKHPWVKSILVSTVKKSNDKNTWYVINTRSGNIVDPRTDSGAAIYANCKMWRDTVLSAKITVDDSDIKTEAVGTVDATVSKEF
jgi:hypothetical protein